MYMVHLIPAVAKNAGMKTCTGMAHVVPIISVGGWIYSEGPKNKNELWNINFVGARFPDIFGLVGAWGVDFL